MVIEKKQGNYHLWKSLIEQLPKHPRIAAAKEIYAIVIAPINEPAIERDGNPILDANGKQERWDAKARIFWRNQSGDDEGKHRTSCVWDMIK